MTDAPDLEPAALEAAIAVLAEHGIDIRMPSECDLDDLERGRFDAISGAISAYLAVREVESAAKEIADWSNLPKDIYVVAAKSHGDIAFDVTCCSVPMITAPEVRYTRADLSALAARSVPEAGKALDAEAALRAVKPVIEALIAQEYNVETWGLRSRLAAIEAALASVAEPIAWMFELANARNTETDEPCNWGKPQLSFTPPCAGKYQRNVTPLYAALASVPAPSGAIKIDDVDRDMIARGDRIGADLQRALLKFYDDHAISSSEPEPKAKKVQHRVRPHKKAEWGPWTDGYVPKDYLGWFELREVAPQAVPAEDVARIAADLTDIASLLAGDCAYKQADTCREAAAALTASEAEAISLRKTLAEARERINRYADTAEEHDLVARIDALEDKP